MKPTFGTIYTEELQNQIIFNPTYKMTKPQLLVLSGFASAAFSRQILTEHPFASVNLIVGMAAQTGMLRAEHDAFVELQSKLYPKRFKCKYYFGKPLIHSKIYVWQDGDNPSSGFAGSANFTWGGFRDNQEILIAADPNQLKPIYEKALSKTVACIDSGVSAKIKFIERRAILNKTASIREASEKKTFEEATQLEKIELSLLDRRGNIHNRGGLNWGQRDGRDPDQAYIPIPVSVDRNNPGFLPHRGHKFLLITDDEKYLWCARGGDNGKNLLTPEDNSEMGRYFRNRMGLPSGKFILKEDLEQYGRTSILISKIDGDTFLMDFAPK